MADPSDAEFDVLKLFWRDGPLSAQAFTGSQLLNPEEIAELQAILDTDAAHSTNEDPS